MSQVPSLCFSPALWTTHYISVPLNALHTSDSEGVKLLLRARLKIEHAKQLIKRNVKIQAWTNAPVEGRILNVDEWTAYTFDLERNHSVLESQSNDEVDENVAVLPLVDESTLQAVEGDFDVTTTPNIVDLQLGLQLSPESVEKLLIHNQPDLHFALMYRLLSPDAAVTWLAPYKHDALYVLRKGNPWVAISDAWFEGISRPADEEVRVLEHRGAIQTSQRPDEVHVGQVRHDGDWGCWALGEGSVQYYPQGAPLSNAKALIFVPRPNPLITSAPDPIALWSPSPGASLSLSSSGHISISCPRTIAIHVPESTTNAAAGSTTLTRAMSPISICTANNYALVGALRPILPSLHLRSFYVGDIWVLGLITTRSGSNENTAGALKISFIPLRADRREVTFSSADLVRGVPTVDGITEHILYCPATKRIIHIPSTNQHL